MCTIVCTSLLPVCVRVNSTNIWYTARVLPVVQLVLYKRRIIHSVLVLVSMSDWLHCLFVTVCVCVCSLLGDRDIN